MEKGNKEKIDIEKAIKEAATLYVEKVDEKLIQEAKELNKIKGKKNLKEDKIEYERFQKLFKEYFGDDEM